MVASLLLGCLRIQETERSELCLCQCPILATYVVSFEFAPFDVRIAAHRGLLLVPLAEILLQLSVIEEVGWIISDGGAV